MVELDSCKSEECQHEAQQVHDIMKQAARRVKQQHVAWVGYLVSMQSHSLQVALSHIETLSPGVAIAVLQT